MVAFLVGIILSWPLWWGHEYFPALPFAGIQIPKTIDRVLVLALMLALTGTCISARRIFPVVTIAISLPLLLADQMRWQPWVYLYLLLLVPYAVTSTDDVKYYYDRWVLAGLYVWSGIQKMNVYFPDKTYKHIVNSLFHYNFQSPDDPIRLLGYAPGIIESLLGLCLLFVPLRRIAAVGVIVMHVFILGYVGYLGQHTLILIPWNVAMIVFVLLFFFSPQTTSKGLTTGRELTDFARELKVNWRFQWGVLLSIALVWVFPILSLFNRWDHFLSFSLFSDNASDFYIVVRDDQADRIPKDIRQYNIELPGITGGKIIDVEWWARAEKKVPFYPEERVFRTLAGHFCEFGADPGSLVFLEIRKTQGKPLINFTCDSISKRP